MALTLSRKQKKHSTRVKEKGEVTALAPVQEMSELSEATSTVSSAEEAEAGLYEALSKVRPELFTGFYEEVIEEVEDSDTSSNSNEEIISLNGEEDNDPFMQDVMEEKQDKPRRLKRKQPSLEIAEDEDDSIDSLPDIPVAKEGGLKDTVFTLIEILIAVAIFAIIGMQLGGMSISDLVSQFVGG